MLEFLKSSEDTVCLMGGRGQDSVNEVAWQLMANEVPMGSKQSLCDLYIDQCGQRRHTSEIDLLFPQQYYLSMPRCMSSKGQWRITGLGFIFPLFTLQATRFQSKLMELFLR